MIVFLKKIRVKTIFSAFEPVVVEPLEICYLKSVLNSMDIENYIIDELFDFKEPSLVAPNVIVLTGYNVAENEIIREAQCYKEKYPQVKIIVGGVHIQGNADAFHQEGIDYVCHTQSLNTFKELIYKILNKEECFLSGINFIKKDKNNIRWHDSTKEILEKKEDIIPDRSFFYKYSNKLRYLEKRNVALIKGSIGCPYKCSYCYCKLLNSGNYVKANYEALINEMESIHADYFWVVDDVLFTSRSDALRFIEIVREKKLKLQIIAYLRADFILREKDLLSSLRDAGIVEIIVGFEATANDELKGYEKTTNALDYPEVIALLKQNNIDLTALFMVQPDYKIKDFINLYKFIRNNNIDVYTVSILTPIKGTKDYELLKGKLITDEPKKFDFLHLVLKPRLPKWLFYMMFYFVHIRLLKSKRVWKYLFEWRHNYEI
ncbi:MAG: radical SAM protein [Sedimentibacter sp.]